MQTNVTHIDAYINIMIIAATQKKNDKGDFLVIHLEEIDYAVKSFG